MEKISIWSLLPEELEKILSAEGLKKFRTQQILNWLYKNRVSSFDEMRNIDKTTKSLLEAKFTIELPAIKKISKSSDGTNKFLLKLADSSLIEMVLIPAEEKLTLCISSQVGCRRGCTFCATSKLGFKRNLLVDEIIAQVILAVKNAEQKLTNIVFMGMGEPLDNLDNVIKAVKLLQHEKCMSFSPRRVTISTCGVVPKIFQLADMKLKIKLAVSLNAALDSKRARIMPVNNKFNLTTLKNSLRYFQKYSPHRITLEYVLIKNLNMTAEDIEALRVFCGDLSCKINLIPWNAIPGDKWQPPSKQEVIKFQQELMKRTDSAVTLRNSRGQDISAACGMLAAKNA